VVFGTTRLQQQAAVESASEPAAPSSCDKNLAQRNNQLISRNMALLELNPELERFVLRLEMKNEWPRPLRAALLFLALPRASSARQSALQDALKHLGHFLFGRLPRNL